MARRRPHWLRAAALLAVLAAAAADVPSPAPGTPTLVGSDTELEVQFAWDSAWDAAAITGFSFDLLRVAPDPAVTALAPPTPAATVPLASVTCGGTSATTLPAGGAACSFTIAQADLPEAHRRGRFRVALRAVNADGASDASGYSGTTSGDILGVPDAPTGFTATGANGKMTISFEVSALNVALGARISISESDGTDWGLLAVATAAGPLSFNLIGEAGTYTIRLDTRNTNGAGASTPFLTVAVPLPTPSTPTLDSGRSLTVRFDCQNLHFDWANLAWFSYRLTRVDVAPPVDVLVPDGTPQGKVDIAAVTRDTTVTPATCSFGISTGTIPGTANDVGQYKVSLVAEGTAGASLESGTSGIAYLGDPPAPTGDPPIGVWLANGDSLDPNFAIEFDAPAADVAGGWYFTLRFWTRGATSASADAAYILWVSNAAGGSFTYLSVPRDDPGVLAPVPGSSPPKWRISLPRSSLWCGGSRCGAGKYQLVSFGAYSRFTGTSGDFLAATAGSYTYGQKIGAASLSSDFTYYGNPAPFGLAVLPAAAIQQSPIRLHIEAPLADVASAYSYTLLYFPIQGDASRAVPLAGSVPRSSVSVSGSSYKVFVISIDLPTLDCDPGPGTRACGKGSYVLTSLVAVTRVPPGAGGANVAADLAAYNALSALDKPIVVGMPLAPSGIAVRDWASPADAAFSFALPSDDIAVGYLFSLRYTPPAGGAAYDIREGPDTILAVRRDSPAGGAAQLTVDAAAGTITIQLGLPARTCNGTPCGPGRYELRTLRAAAYIASSGLALSDRTAFETSAVQIYTSLPTTQFTVFAPPVISRADGDAAGALLWVVQEPSAAGATYTLRAFSDAACTTQVGANVAGVDTGAPAGAGTPAAPWKFRFPQAPGAELWFKVVMASGSITTTSLPIGPVVAGAPAAPVLLTPQAAGPASASVAWQAVPTATSYTLTASRSGGAATDIATVIQVADHTDGATHTLDLSNASDGLGGCGKWQLRVAASNAYTPTAPGVFHTASTSTSALSAWVTVGVPLAPTGVTLISGAVPGQATLSFSAPTINAEIGAAYTAVATNAAGTADLASFAGVLPGPTNLLALPGGTYRLRIDTSNSANGAGASYTHGSEFDVGPADAPIIEAAAGAATGALLTVQRPSNLRDGATVVYLFQAYFPGGAPVNAEQQVAPTSGSGADGDELRFLVPAPLFTPLVFRVTAAVGAARARSPASAPSSQVLAGMPDPAAITSVFGNTYGVFPTFAKTAHADSYNVHVCDAAGALVSPPLSQPVTMDLVSGCAGGNIYCYAPVRSDLLGSPAGGAILTIKIESVNVNTAPGQVLSPPSAVVFYGSLATPAAPQLRWLADGSATGRAELRFLPPSPLPRWAPPGYAPIYLYSLYQGVARVAGPTAITIGGAGGATGAGTPGDPFVFAFPALAAGEYTATLQYLDAITQATSSQSAESAPSAVVPFGKPGTPSLVTVAGGAADASLTFGPADRAQYYEVAVLSADGATTAATVPTCAAGSTADCVPAAAVPLTGLLLATIPLGPGPATAPAPGRYRFKLRAVDANGTPGAWSPVLPAAGASPETVTVGVPAAVAAPTASSGASGVALSFTKTELADSYILHGCDAAGALLSPALIQPLSGCAGAGVCNLLLDASMLGSPPGGAMLRFKIESVNANTAPSQVLSPPSNVACYGRLATPAAPQLRWLADGSRDGRGELRFLAPSAPPLGAPPAYLPAVRYGLRDDRGWMGPVNSIPRWATSGAGTPGDPFVFTFDALVAILPPGGQFQAFLSSYDTTPGCGIASDMSNWSDLAFLEPPGTPSPVSAAGGPNSATLTFSPGSRAQYYEVAVLSADGATTLATVPTCKAGSTTDPAGCVPAAGTPLVATLQLAALPAPGRYRFKVRSLDANAQPGTWSAVAPAAGASPVTVGAPGAWAPGAVVVQSTYAAGCKLAFPPVHLAESYEIEVLDKDGTLVRSVAIDAAALATCTAR